MEKVTKNKKLRAFMILAVCIPVMALSAKQLFHGIGEISEAASLHEAAAAARRGDYETALRVWHSLAEQGSAMAAYNIGDMYSLGRGVGQDQAEAMRWFRRAADQGDAASQYNLGVMYFEGRGVTTEP